MGDDMDLDILLPKQLGLKAILLDRGGQCVDVTAPDAVVGSLTEALDIVREWV